MDGSTSEASAAEQISGWGGQVRVLSNAELACAMPLIAGVECPIGHCSDGRGVPKGTLIVLIGGA
jgi:hypothetical protein